MYALVTSVVSIHAPREGCDCSYLGRLTFLTRFNSRTPGGVRLMCEYLCCRFCGVSIHAPREGCDGDDVRLSFLTIACFNSRTPGGVRLRYPLRVSQRRLCFNSRTPGGVRHWVRRTLLSLYRRFNSRTPGGVRHVTEAMIMRWICVSIHAPREGCDAL